MRSICPPKQARSKSVQGRLKAAILLCLPHVDTVAIGAWLGFCLCGVRRRKKQVPKRNEKNTITPPPKGTYETGGGQKNGLGIDPEKIISPSSITG